MKEIVMILAVIVLFNSMAYSDSPEFPENAVCVAKVAPIKCVVTQERRVWFGIGACDAAWAKCTSAAMLSLSDGSKKVIQFSESENGGCGYFANSKAKTAAKGTILGQMTVLEVYPTCK